MRKPIPSSTSLPRIASILALLLLLPAIARADIVITLKNAFIDKFKDRATIDASFTVAHAHAHPNSPSKDGDLHASGLAPEIGLAAVAEVMNAASEPAALDLIHQSEQDHQPLSVNSIWRLWCEHGGDTEHVQGGTIKPITNTNPDHIFEIHPLLRVGGEDLTDDFHDIAGFTYKDARQAFTNYEQLPSRITVGSGTTTITTRMAGFNYVEFLLRLNEDPTHTLDDGLTVMATVLDLDGEILVRNRRMVFAAGTAPFEKIRTMHRDETLHVVGIPRINLSLVAWRTSHRTSRPEALQWSLPYEIVVVAAFDDVPEGPDVEPVPGSGGQPPAPRTESDMVGALLQLLSQSLPPSADRGACRLSLGTSAFCASLTHPLCDQLGGSWTEGAACPPGGNP